MHWTKNEVFHLRISSVNVTKSAVASGFGQKKSVLENFIFCPGMFNIYKRIAEYDQSSEAATLLKSRFGMGVLL